MQQGFEPLHKTLQASIETAGFILVEAKFLQKKSSVRAYITIYKDSGISTDDCSKVYWIVQPILLSWFHCDDEHLFIEVSSPGLDRVFKSPEEYGIFKGKVIKVIQKNGLVSIGTLLGADTTQVFLQSGNEELALSFETIARASLFSDYSEHNAGGTH